MQQITLDYFKPHYSINQPVRLIELFAGIGSQAKALQKLGVDFEKWIISEWEANATKSYKAIHCENDNTDYSKGLNQKELINALFSMGISNDGKEPMTLQQIARKNEKWLRETYNAYKATHNISNLMLAAGKDLNIVDVEKYVYILTYSFPCQDLSIAGKQAGMTKGSKTRSGLLWEVERLLKECENLPQVLLMENVTQVHSKKNFADFKKWVECLDDLGYSNYYADLNAKDYGVPQNRNRTFMISILGNYYYQFPEPFKLQKRLKDILETDVDEKYYLSNKISQFVTEPFRMQKKYTTVNADVASSLKAKDYANWNGNYITEPCIAASRGRNPDNPNDRTAGIELEQRLEIKADGTSNTLTTIQKDNLVVEPILYASVDKNIKPCVAENFKRELSDIVKSKKDIYQCKCSSGFQDNKVGLKQSPTIRAGNNNTFCLDNNFHIRQLTTKECLRLMTFDDADYEKIKAAGISDSVIYKQAGNSIVVNVMVFIFAMLFDIKVNFYEV